MTAITLLSCLGKFHEHRDTVNLPGKVWAPYIRDLPSQQAMGSIGWITTRV